MLRRSPTSRPLHTGLLAAFVLAPSACLVDIPNVGQGQYACEQDTDCVSGWQCGPDGFCVRADGGDSGSACSPACTPGVEACIDNGCVTVTLQVTPSYTWDDPTTAGETETESHWNHWGTEDNPAVDCDENVGPLGCVHRGEMFHVVTPWPSCDGLSMTDDLDAFDWSCSIDGNEAVFQTTALKQGRSIRDLLLANASGWKANFVTLSAGETFSSEPAAWWSTPVETLTDTVHSLTRTDPPRPVVYAAPSTVTTSHVDIDDDWVTLVTLTGVIQSGDIDVDNCDVNGNDPGVASCLVSALDHKWLWLEADVTNTSTTRKVQRLVLLRGVSGALVQNGSALGPTADVALRVKDGSSGIWIRNWTVGNIRGFVELPWTEPKGMYVIGRNIRMTDVLAYDIRDTDGTQKGGDGILIGDDNLSPPGSFTVERAKAFNCESSGMVLSWISDPYTGDGYRLRDIVTAFNDGNGIEMGNASNTIVIDGIIAANNGGNGIVLDSGYRSTTPTVKLYPTDTRLMRAIAVNNAGHGIVIDDGESEDTLSHYAVGWSTAANNQGRGIDVTRGAVALFQVLTVNNGDMGIRLNNSAPSYLANAASQNNVREGIYYGGLQASVEVAGSLYLGGNSSGCATVAPNPVMSYDDECGSTGKASYQNVPLSLDAIVGPVSADAANLKDNAAYTSFPALTPTIPARLFDFETAQRIWAPEGDPLSAAARGPCVTAEACRIWDWGLHEGSGAPAESWWPGWAGGTSPFQGSGTACADVSATPTVSVDAINRPIIALELEGDDDGLCEGGETCLYAPNPGAYQGHDALAADSCTLSLPAGGTATLVHHSTMGVP